jgi:protein O-GlcNAc transferase
MIGLAAEALPDYARAEKAYSRAVELAAGEYRPSYAYGCFLYRQGRTAEAIGHLRAAVEREPRAADARFELGKALLQQRELAQAARETEAAIALAPECRFRYQLSRIYREQGRSADADAVIRQMKDCGPN